MTDLGYSEYPSLFHALRAQIMRTIRTWRYAKSVGADPTVWWGVYERGTENCLASVGPLPGARERAIIIAAAIEAERKQCGLDTTLTSLTLPTRREEEVRESLDRLGDRLGDAQ
jgi:hypothetical protein